MTTPDTSAVRAWARQNGYAVADRGRLPAEVTDAYKAAHSGSRAKKAAPRKKAAPAQPHVDTTPQPKPSPVTDDRRLVALGEEIKALTARVEALEKAAGGGKASGGKAGRFRRRT